MNKNMNKSTSKSKNNFTNIILMVQLLRKLFSCLLYSSIYIFLNITFGVVGYGKLRFIFNKLENKNKLKRIYNKFFAFGKKLINFSLEDLSSNNKISENSNESVFTSILNEKYTVIFFKMYYKMNFIFNNLKKNNNLKINNILKYLLTVVVPYKDWKTGEEKTEELTFPYYNETYVLSAEKAKYYDDVTRDLVYSFIFSLPFQFVLICFFIYLIQKNINIYDLRKRFRIFCYLCLQCKQHKLTLIKSIKIIILFFLVKYKPLLRYDDLDEINYGHYDLDYYEIFPRKTYREEDYISLRSKPMLATYRVYEHLTIDYFSCKAFESEEPFDAFFYYSRMALTLRYFYFLNYLKMKKNDFLGYHYFYFGYVWMFGVYCGYLYIHSVVILTRFFIGFLIEFFGYFRFFLKSLQSIVLDLNGHDLIKLIYVYFFMNIRKTLVNGFYCYDSYMFKFTRWHIKRFITTHILNVLFSWFFVPILTFGSFCFGTFYNIGYFVYLNFRSEEIIYHIETYVLDCFWTLSDYVYDKYIYRRIFLVWIYNLRPLTLACEFFISIIRSLVSIIIGFIDIIFYFIVIIFLFSFNKLIFNNFFKLSYYRFINFFIFQLIDYLYFIFHTIIYCLRMLCLPFFDLILIFIIYPVLFFIDMFVNKILNPIFYKLLKKIYEILDLYNRLKIYVFVNFIHKKIKDFSKSSIHFRALVSLYPFIIIEKPLNIVVINPHTGKREKIKPCEFIYESPLHSFKALYQYLNPSKYAVNNKNAYFCNSFFYFDNFANTCRGEIEYFYDFLRFRCVFYWSCVMGYWYYKETFVFASFIISADVVFIFDKNFEFCSSFMISQEFLDYFLQGYSFWSVFFSDLLIFLEELVGYKRSYATLYFTNLDPKNGVYGYFIKGMPESYYDDIIKSNEEERLRIHGSYQALLERSRHEPIATYYGFPTYGLEIPPLVGTPEFQEWEESIKNSKLEITYLENNLSAFDYALAKSKYRLFCLLPYFYQEILNTMTIYAFYIVLFQAWFLFFYSTHRFLRWFVFSARATDSIEIKYLRYGLCNSFLYGVFTLSISYWCAQKIIYMDYWIIPDETYLRRTGLEIAYWEQQNRPKLPRSPEDDYMFLADHIHEFYAFDDMKVLMQMDWDVVDFVHTSWDEVERLNKKYYTFSDILNLPSTIFNLLWYDFPNNLLKGPYRSPPIAQFYEYAPPLDKDLPYIKLIEFKESLYEYMCYWLFIKGEPDTPLMTECDIFLQYYDRFESWLYNIDSDNKDNKSDKNNTKKGK